MPKKPSADSKDQKRINPALRYSGMAAQMAGFTVMGFFGGGWIDNYFGFEKPVFAIALLLLFLTAFMIKLIKDVSQDK